MKRKSRRAELRLKLRTLRASLDLSQIDLAERANLSESRYWRIENGYDIPTEDEVRRLAKALRTTPDQILPSEAVTL